MDVTFINTVIKSVANVLEQMTQMEINAGKPKVKQPMEEAEGVVTGVMSMTGKDAVASVALSFSKEAALALANKMLPDEHHDIDHMVIDLVGELANMVIGDAKRQLQETGLDFSLSLPVIIYGPNHLIAHKANAPVLAVPFFIDEGCFTVEAVYEKSK